MRIRISKELCWGISAFCFALAMFVVVPSSAAAGRPIKGGFHGQGALNHYFTSSVGPEFWLVSPFGESGTGTAAGFGRIVQGFFSFRSFGPFPDDIPHEVVLPLQQGFWIRSPSATNTFVSFTVTSGTLKVTALPEGGGFEVTGEGTAEIFWASGPGLEGKTGTCTWSLAMTTGLYVLIGAGNFEYAVGEYAFSFDGAFDD